MITQLRISNYRSLASKVRIDLGSLTVLVGQNGAGKSNTIDALVFLADCMSIGLEGAVTKRHGIAAVRRANPQAHPYDVGIGVDLDLPDGRSATYEVVLTGAKVEEYRVKREHARVSESATAAGVSFLVENGKWVDGPADVRPHVESMSLALPLLGGDARFSVLVAALRSVAAYSIYPDVLRKPQDYNPARPMDRLGANWVSILKDQPSDTWKHDLVEVLHQLTGDITDVEVERIGGYLALKFKHGGAEGKRSRWSAAAQESDGTLRVAGMMTALLQRPRPLALILEEPELTIHPGALGLMKDYIVEASTVGQVLLTTHSPDLLDWCPPESIRVVEREAGASTVAPLDRGQYDVVRNGLFSLGEVMRSESLRQEQLELPMTAS
jgi:predicted ATPase